jgi:hypothetical protein
MAVSKFQEFKNSFKTDLARPSRFEVDIMSKNYGGIRAADLRLRCETAELPSRTYATAEQKFGSNPVEKFPYQVQFNDLNLTFIVSDDMSPKYFFDAWMEDVVPSFKYNPNYKYGDDEDIFGGYTGSIIITQFDVTDSPTYKIELIDAYPITVNQLDLDWSTEGHHKLTVVFAYTYWQSSLKYPGIKNYTEKLFSKFNPNSEL